MMLLLGEAGSEAHIASSPGPPIIVSAAMGALSLASDNPRLLVGFTPSRNLCAVVGKGLMEYLRQRRA